METRADIFSMVNLFSCANLFGKRRYGQHGTSIIGKAYKGCSL